MGLLSSMFGSRPKVTPEHVDSRASFRTTVIESKLPVIVDVWSPSCGPCQKLVPVLIDVATRHEGKVRVAEISTEAEPALLAQLGVRSTPTIIVYDKGREVGRMSGYRPAGWFDELIETEFS